MRDRKKYFLGYPRLIDKEGLCQIAAKHGPLPTMVSYASFLSRNCKSKFFLKLEWLAKKLAVWSIYLINFLANGFEL